MKATLALICALFAAGCSFTRDITHDPRYASERGEYMPGATYWLKQDVQIVDWYAGRSFLDPPQFPVRYSLMEIRPENSVNSADIVHRGDRLQMMKILHYENFEDIWIFAVARILDGSHIGMDVDFHYISYGGKIDSAFLERE